MRSLYAIMACSLVASTASITACSQPDSDSADATNQADTVQKNDDVSTNEAPIFLHCSADYHFSTMDLTLTIKDGAATIDGSFSDDKGDFGETDGKFNAEVHRLVKIDDGVATGISAGVDANADFTTEIRQSGFTVPNCTGAKLTAIDFTTNNDGSSVSLHGKADGCSSQFDPFDSNGVWQFTCDFTAPKQDEKDRFNTMVSALDNLQSTGSGSSSSSGGPSSK